MLKEVADVLKDVAEVFEDVPDVLKDVLELFDDVAELLDDVPDLPDQPCARRTAQKRRQFAHQRQTAYDLRQTAEPSLEWVMTAVAQELPDLPQVGGPSTWLETLGSLFRKTLRSEADILSLVESGVTNTVYIKVSEHLHLPKDAIGAETTIRNRLKSHSRLNADETERLLMIGRVYAMARDLFGSDEAAIAWLHKPARYLRDKAPVAPIELATRDAGVRLLEEKLLRTAHGMF